MNGVSPEGGIADSVYTVKLNKTGLETGLRAFHLCLSADINTRVR